MGVVLYVWDWITVRDGPSVMCSVVFTGLPTTVLRHEIEGGDHGPSACLAVPSRSMASNSALASAKRFGVKMCGRKATGGQVAARSGRLWHCAASCVAGRLHVAWRSTVCGGETLAGSTAGPCPLAR